MLLSSDDHMGAGAEQIAGMFVLQQFCSVDSMARHTRSTDLPLVVA